VAIKPSGVSYETLTPDQIVILDQNGRIIEGVDITRVEKILEDELATMK